MPQQYVVNWQGGRIGSGASVFHFALTESDATANDIALATRDMFHTLRSLFPNDVSFSFDPEVTALSNAGALIGVWSVSQPDVVIGSNNGNYINGAGAMVRHSTGEIVARRRLVGRTFMVPLPINAFGADGDVTVAVQTQINAAFQTFRAAVAGAGAPLVVWSRTHQVVAPVTDSATQSRPSSLSTRNDRL